MIPVLVKGARLPAAADLPVDLRPLTRRQAMQFAESTWRAQTEDMLARLGQSIDPPLPWARTPTSIVVSSALSSAVASLPGVAIGGLFPPRSNPWATIFAALVGALSTAALVVVVVAARRSAWPARVAVGMATVVGGFLNGVLGIVPLTGVNVYVLYAFGFALSAFAAMLPTQSVQHIALGSLLGALGGVIVAALQGIDGNSVTMLVFAVAIYGALVAMAIAVAPRPSRLLHR